MSSQKMLRIIVILCTVFISLYLILPKPIYHPAGWAKALDGSIRINQFSKYVLPEQYKYMQYLCSTIDRQKCVIFRNQETKQSFFIFILRELPKVRFDDLEISDRSIIRTYTIYKQDISRAIPFNLRYLVPVFIKKDLIREYPQAEIRGMKVSSQENYETSQTDILVATGTFQKLGFYRKSGSFFFKYPVPIFNAVRDMHGAIAVINNKKNHETIFAFGCNDVSRDYDHEEFLEIVKSVTFDKRPRALFGNP
jgi:hypothetical protein